MPNWIITCCFLIHVIGWIMTLYDVHVLNPPEPGSLHVKSNVDMWLEIWGWGYFILDDPTGSDVITKALERERQGKQSEQQEAGGWSDVKKGPWAKESRQSLETKHCKEMNSSLKLPSGTQPHWILILDFWPPELWKNTFMLFQVIKFLVIGTVAIGN